MSYESSLLPNYLDTVLFQDTDFYEKNTTLLNLFGDFIDILTHNIQYEKNKSSSDFLNRLVSIYKELNGSDFKINDTKIDIQNKNYYIEKYQSLSDKLKTIITDILGLKNVYFKDLSDDVGSLIDTHTIVDTSIIPYFDIFYNLTGKIPNNIPNTIYNKITDENKKLQQNFSLKNDAILKNNINGLVNYDSSETSRTPHGFDLVTDYPYFDRLISFSEEIRQSIFIELTADLGEYIYFLKNLNIRNQQDNNAVFLQYSCTLEDIEQNLDIFKNEIVSKAYKNNDVLN